MSLVPESCNSAVDALDVRPPLLHSNSLSNFIYCGKRRALTLVFIHSERVYLTSSIEHTVKKSLELSLSARHIQKCCELFLSRSYIFVIVVNGWQEVERGEIWNRNENQDECEEVEKWKICERRRDRRGEEKMWKTVLAYGKYIEYKSCQINKINVVPITIISLSTYPS